MTTKPCPHCGVMIDVKTFAATIGLASLDFTIQEQIKEVKREISFREVVYPRWVSKNQYSVQQLDRQLRIMKAVLSTLREIEEAGRLL